MSKEFFGKVEYGFCPYCLENHEIDPDENECADCGCVIPDGILELEAGAVDAERTAKLIATELNWYRKTNHPVGSLEKIQELLRNFLGDEYPEDDGLF